MDDPIPLVPVRAAVELIVVSHDLPGCSHDYPSRRPRCPVSISQRRMMSDPEPASAHVRSRPFEQCDQPTEASSNVSHIGNAGPFPSLKLRARSGSGGHVGGEDVVRVAAGVLAGPVVAHRGARICVAGRDLDVAQVQARAEHGGDEGARGGRSAGRGSVPTSGGGSLPIAARAVRWSWRPPPSEFTRRGSACLAADELGERPCGWREVACALPDERDREMNGGVQAPYLETGIFWRGERPGKDGGGEATCSE